LQSSPSPATMPTSVPTSFTLHASRATQHNVQAGWAFVSSSVVRALRISFNGWNRAVKMHCLGTLYVNPSVHLSTIIYTPTNKKKDVVGGVININVDFVSRSRRWFGFYKMTHCLASKQYIPHFEDKEHVSFNLCQKYQARNTFLTENASISITPNMIETLKAQLTTIWFDKLKSFQPFQRILKQSS